MSELDQVAQQLEEAMLHDPRRDPIAEADAYRDTMPDDDEDLLGLAKGEIVWLREGIRRLTIALERRTLKTDEETDWQPIESAPRDGTSVLAIWCYDPDDPEKGSLTHDVVRWCGWWDSNGFTQPEPSHWMRLPDPPRAALSSIEEQRG